VADDLHTTADAAPASAGTATWRGLWLDTTSYDQLLAALTVAANRTEADLDCAACAQGRCADPHHREPATQVRAWRGLAQKLANTASTGMGAAAAPAGVVFDPDAARQWLADGAADEFGIDESFTTVELTIAAGLEDLLGALAYNTEPQVWATQPPLDGVLAWRTADGDGVDGGAILTADLRFGDHTVRLATCHQAHDEFVDDEATSGIDAAIEALAHVAQLVNREVAGLLAATATRPPAGYTVVGVWMNDQPIPVGVIAGEHQVHDGDATEFEQGLWATSVAAPDSSTAQQRAVDEMREG
jgi:hypothetical protein